MHSTLCYAGGVRADQFSVNAKHFFWYPGKIQKSVGFDLTFKQKQMKIYSVFHNSNMAFCTFEHNKRKAHVKIKHA